MKRVVSVLLLGLLVMHSMGNFMLIHSMKASVRKHAKRQVLSGMPDSDLVTIAHNQWEKPDFVFKDEGKEIFRHGKMYDIVRKEQKGDLVVYYCFDDTDESKLNHMLDQATRQENQKNKSLALSIIKLVTTNDTEIVHPPVNYCGCIELGWNNYSVPAVLRMASNVPTPPPDQAIA